MHGIGSIGIHPANFASQGTGMNSPSGASGSGFHLASLTGGVGQPVARGVSSTGTGSLGSQTVSTLLQTQDLSQTQIRGGGGHGGGGHHGMKMVAGGETEETMEAEEASSLHAQKKTGKTAVASDAEQVAESGEEGDVTPEAKDKPQNATNKDLRTNR